IQEITPQLRQLATHPREGQVTLKTPPPGSQPGVLVLTVSPTAARVLLGTDPASAGKGQSGKQVTLHLMFDEQTAPARNVVAIIPGSDAALRGEYVALGAHND